MLDLLVIITVAVVAMVLLLASLATLIQLIKDEPPPLRIYRGDPIMRKLECPRCGNVEWTDDPGEVECGLCYVRGEPDAEMVEVELEEDPEFWRKWVDKHRMTRAITAVFPASIVTPV